MLPPQTDVREVQHAFALSRYISTVMNMACWSLSVANHLFGFVYVRVEHVRVVAE